MGEKPRQDQQAQDEVNVTLTGTAPNVLAVTFLGEGRQMQLRVFTKAGKTVHTIVRSKAGSNTIWIEARFENMPLEKVVEAYEARVAAASKAA